MYWVHTSGVKVAQNCLIPSLSSCKFFGLNVLLDTVLVNPRHFQQGLDLEILGVWPTN